jgi:heme a synthase
MHRSTLQAARVDAPARDASAVSFWLFAVAALIFAMVLVGGATRLTKSGVSIKQWKPVTGVTTPPL